MKNYENVRFESRQTSDFCLHYKLKSTPACNSFHSLRRIQLSAAVNLLIVYSSDAAKQKMKKWENNENNI